MGSWLIYLILFYSAIIGIPIAVCYAVYNIVKKKYSQSTALVVSLLALAGIIALYYFIPLG